MIKRWITAPNGAVILNPLIRYVKGGLIIPSSNQVPLTIAAAPSATVPTRSAPIIIEAGQDGPAEIFSTIGQHGASDAAAVQARLSCVITDDVYRRQYMNRDILCNHVFGNNLQPFDMKETTFLQPQQTMQFVFLNNSTAGASSWRFALAHRKFQSTGLTTPETQNWVREQVKRKCMLNSFWLTSTDPVSIPANGKNTTSLFKNTPDKWLCLFYIMATGLTTGVAGDTTELFNFTIFDPKNYRPYMNSPVTLNTGCGTARFPYVLPQPIFMEPNSTMQVLFNNLVTDAATEVFFTFYGVASYTGKPLWKAQGERGVG